MQINELFILVILLLAGCIYHGYRKGLIHIGISIGVFLLTLLLTGMIAPVCAKALKQNEAFCEKIQRPIEEVLSENIEIAPQLTGIAAEGITWKTIDVVVYAILFLCLNVILRVIGEVANIVARIPGIVQLNRLAGSIFGIVEGISIVWSLFLVLTIFASTSAGHWCFVQITENEFLSFLYTRNIFFVFLK